MRMSWRLASRLSVIITAFLVVLVVALWGLRATDGGAAANTTTNQSNFQGTDLGSQPAPDFRLDDQTGKSISLSQFQGQPVVLTFLYTHCPDVCPLTAEKLHSVQTQLGKNASKVTMLAVSIDPKGDTQKAVQNFSQLHKLSQNWHYLIGSQSELAPVWDSYTIYAQPNANAKTVTHTAAVYVIDKAGRERVFFGDDFTPTQLIDDLKTLLSE